MEPSRVRVTFSQKGKQKLCMEGYVYDRNKISKDGRRIYWECERRRDIQCNVRLTTRTEAVLISGPRGEHNHDSNASHIESLDVRQKLKVEAESRPDTARRRQLPKFKMVIH
jgi:hypothetical protein